MARRQSFRVRSAARCLAALGMASLAGLHWSGRAYVVKSSWEGEPSSVKKYDSLAKGMEPTVALPDLTFVKSDGVSLTLQDGHLVANYKGKLGGDTNLGLSVNDDQVWNALLDSGATSLKLRGQGKSLDGWEASQSGSADGVGDVSLLFNSDKDYKLTVVNDDLAEISGASFSGKAIATRDGFTGRIESRYELPGRGNQGALKWSIENAIGDYELSHATQTAEFAQTIAGGDASAKVTYENKGLGYEGAYSHPVRGGQAVVKVALKDGVVGYNATYAEKVNALADVLVGLDTDGAYGAVSASRKVMEGLNAEYEARARASFDSESKPQLSHALKLSNKLGYAQLVHGTDEAPRLRMGYEFTVDV